MKTTLITTVTTVILTIALTTSILAQDSPQWNLPDHATSRIGKGKINQIAYSPDDSILAVATHIGIWLYDAQTGSELDLLTGHTGTIRSIAFSPDGTILASGSSDNTIRLWDFPNRSHLRTLTGHTSTITNIVFSSDGNTLISGGVDRTVRFWNVNTGIEDESSLQRYSSGITSLQFNKDSTILAISSNNTIHLYDFINGTHLRTITADINNVNTLSFSPTENIIASAGWDKTIQIWDVETGDQLSNYIAHTHNIETLTFSKDGKLIISGSIDKTISVSHAKSGIKQRTITDHTGTVKTIALNSDGTRLASGSTDGTVREWRGKLETTLTQTRTIARHGDYGQTITYAPNGSTFASGSIDGKVHLWHKTANDTLQTRVLTGHTEDVAGVAFSPNSKLLLTGSHDGTMRLWNVESGYNIHTFVRRMAYIEDVAFSPDGNLVADVGFFMGSTINIYDVNTGEQKSTIQAFTLGPLSSNPNPTSLPFVHADSVNRIVFTQDSKMIASCSGDGTIRLWDVETGKHLRVFNGHTDEVYGITFSPDGAILASASNDNTIRLWDTDSGRHLRTLIGHTDGVRSVAFNPNGRTIVSGSVDNTVRLWNVHNGMQLREFTGHKSWVYDVDFSPNGNTLASISADGTILLWDITPTEMKPTVSLSPATIESPNVSEQLTFSLNIADGVNVAGYQATVLYDNTALRYIQSANADFLPANVYTITPATTDNSVRIGTVAFGGQQSNMDGTLATITFEVLAVKDSTVRLSGVLLTDPFGVPSVPQIASAHITVPIHIPEDVNEDGVVDVTDLVLVATQFGKRGENDADVNGDGVVDIVDLALVAAKIDENIQIGPAAPGLLTNMPTRATVASWLREARNLNLTDPNFQRGIHFLEMLLANLTPQETALLPNYPNPFNPETWIPYQLASPSDVSIVIYASDGKLVRQLDVGHQPVGIYQHRSNAAYWDGKNQLGEPVASGVYFYTLTAGEFSTTRKMLIRK